MKTRFAPLRIGSEAPPQDGTDIGAAEPPPAAADSTPHWAVWMRALRLHQWVKNVLLVVPLLLAREFTASQCIDVAAGYMIFGVIASGTYLINDLNDLNADRAHAVKRQRPLAAGRISARTAVTVAVLMLAVGLAAAFLLDREFGYTALAYVVITLAYSLRLKMEPMIDVFTIGILFVLRLVAGMVLIDNGVSLWLSGFAFTLFMSLATAKRHSDIINSLRITGKTPEGRGYLPEDLGLTRAFGVGSALIAFLVMLLYFQFQALQSGLYDTVELLYIVPLTVFAWTLRIWLKANRGEILADPITFALKDRISWCYGLFTLFAWLIAIK